MGPLVLGWSLVLDRVTLFPSKLDNLAKRQGGMLALILLECALELWTRLGSSCSCYFDLLVPPQWYRVS